MTQLADLVEMTFGFAFKSAEFTNQESDIRLLRGDNIGQGRLRWEGAKRFPVARAGEVSKYQLAVGDLVLAMDRPWIEAGLKFSVVREKDVPSLLVQRVARLRAKDGLDQGYLAAIIGSKKFMDYVIGTQTGSAVPHISGGQIGAFELDRLPNLREQRAIAATLGALEDKIASCASATGKASELLDSLSTNAGIHLPRVPLSQLVTSARETVNPSTLGAETVDHYSLPAFDAGQLPETVPATDIMSSKSRVPQRAILVSRLNPRFNRTWWVTPRREAQALASTEFLVLKAQDDAELAAGWLAVRDKDFTLELTRRVTGTSGSHQRVRPADLLSIEVPDFSLASNDLKLVALQLLERVEQLRREIVSLAALRDALLPELLSGRITVPSRGPA